jgi:hypothetical protein
MTRIAVAVSMLMTFYSVLPVVVLQLAASNVLRRLHGRVLLWALLAIMTSIVLGLSVQTVYSTSPFNRPFTENKELESQYLQDYMCSDWGAKTDLIVFVWCLGGLLTLSITGYVFTVIARSIWHFSNSSS